MAARRPTKPRPVVFAQTPATGDPKTQRAVDVLAEATRKLQERALANAAFDVFTSTVDGLVPAPNGAVATAVLTAGGTWTSLVSGVSSVSAGSSMVIASPTTGAVVVDVAPANFTGIPQAGVTDLVADLAAKALKTTTISTTAPLSGGGDLSANRTFAISANGIDDTLLRDSAALSVIGRSANIAGDPADIAATADGDVLRRTAGVLGFGTIPSTSVTGLITSVVAGTNLSGGGSSGAVTLNVVDSPNFAGTVTALGVIASTTGVWVQAGGFLVSSGGSTVQALTVQGALSVAGLSTLTGGFTLGAASSAGGFKITSLANGTLASDAAAFGQIATGINAAVSGTTGTLAKFTSANAIGDSPVIDDGTYIRTARRGWFSQDVNSFLQVGYTYTNTTNAQNNITLLTDGGDGNAYVMAKAASTKGLVFSIGQGIEPASTRTWLTVTGSNGDAAFGAAGSFVGNLSTAAKLGVGNDNPLGDGYDLQVRASGQADVEVSIRNSAVGGRNFLLASGADASSVPNSFFIYDATAGANRFRINSTGAVSMPGDLSTDGNFTAGNAVSDQHLMHGRFQINGTTRSTFFNYEGGATEDTYIRGGKATSVVFIGDANTSGAVVIANATAGTTVGGTLQVNGDSTLGDTTADSHTLNGSLTLNGTTATAGKTVVADANNRPVWGGDGFTTLSKSADQDNTTSTYADDTTMQFAVTSGKIYAVEGQIIISAANETAYLLGITTSVGTMDGSGHAIHAGAVSVNSQWLRTAAAASQDLGVIETWLDVGAPNTITFRFTFRQNTSSGTFKLRFKNGGGLGIARTLAGSYIKYKLLN